jgi:DNA repair protein RadC
VAARWRRPPPHAKCLERPEKGATWPEWGGGGRGRAQRDPPIAAGSSPGTPPALQLGVASPLVSHALDSEIRSRGWLGGVEGLADVDLLALLLRRGSNGTPALRRAARLLDESAGLGRLARLGPHGLADRGGVTALEATRLAAALELGRRAAIRLMSDERETIGSFESVVAWARPRLAGLDHEEVWMLALDGRNGLKTARRIARGGLHGCALTPRDVLHPALRDAASALVLVHNHPSGEPAPSTEDVEMTRVLAVACDVVGVPLLDHVIVARGGASSLLELGAIPG